MQPSLEDAFVLFSEAEEPEEESGCVSDQPTGPGRPLHLLGLVFSPPPSSPSKKSSSLLPSTSSSAARTSRGSSARSSPSITSRSSSPRQGLRLPRPERLGKVHDDPDAHGAPHALRGTAHGRGRPRRRARHGRVEDASRVHEPEVLPLSGPDGRGEPDVLRVDLRPSERAPRGPDQGAVGAPSLREAPAALTEGLSTGYRQRVALAAALLHEPELLFLDEPTGGVDPRGRRLFWDLIYELAADKGMTVLVTTHYMDEAEQCDRLAFILDGALIAEGAPPTSSATSRTASCRSRRRPIRSWRSKRSEGPASRGRLPLRGAASRGREARRRRRRPELLARLAPPEPAEPSLEDVFVSLARQSSREGHGRRSRHETVPGPRPQGVPAAQEGPADAAHDRHGPAPPDDDLRLRDQLRRQAPDDGRPRRIALVREPRARREDDRERVLRRRQVRRTRRPSSGARSTRRTPPSAS